ncbi:MAG: DNA-directed RNA polymerase subunit L [Candidatus Bathyarchaeota archaeon]|nr:DNA-directed RNA polymerase subunit L [Candidatus Bathyarchaeota archaeon]
MKDVRLPPTTAKGRFNIEIKILKKTANELKIEIEGEGHTFGNVLQKALLEDDTIEMAGYNIKHPLISNPTVYVRTKEKRKPEAALQDAAKKIRERSKGFRESFKKALKEWQQK